MPAKPLKPLLPAGPPSPVLAPIDQPYVGELKGAPPLPVPKLQRLQEASVPLVDMPCVFLNDRTCWPDFKRALTECGLIWNISEWMTTIVYKGVEWKTIRDNGTDLSAYFPVIEKTGAGDGNFSKTSTLGAKLVGLLSRPTAVADFKPSVQFCCLSTVEFEDDRRLPARQKLWNWIVRSLRGNRTSPGPFHYLVDEIQMYDISYLFKRLVDVLDQITICSLDDELEIIIKMDYKPQTQNIFSYLGDLRKAIKRLNAINERLPAEGRIMLPDSYVRSRLIRAARQVPIYKPVLDSILIADIAEWSKMTSDELYHKLEAVCANDQSVQTNQGYSLATPTYDSVTANSVQLRQEKKWDKGKKQGPCHAFAKGACPRDPCRFSHSTLTPEQKNAMPQTKNAHPKQKCFRCGEEHPTKDCKYNGKCGHCGRNGHMEAVCKMKRAGRPRALLSSVDGHQVYANMFKVSMPMANKIVGDSTSLPPPPSPP